MSYEMGYQQQQQQQTTGGAAVAVAPITTNEPVSRTYQYRKVMKPMLERKRRARINRCLDDLKELMVTALQSEGENVSKLEKADILELTVKHLLKLRRQNQLSKNPVIDTDRFRAGFTHAANEVSRCLASTPGVDIHLGTKLMTHLGHRLNDLDKVQPLTIQVGQTIYTPPTSPTSFTSDITTSSVSPQQLINYSMPLTPSSSRSSQHSATPSPRPIDLATTTTQTNGLLKMVNHHHHHHINQHQQEQQKIDENVWRPW